MLFLLQPPRLSGCDGIVSLRIPTGCIGFLFRINGNCDALFIVLQLGVEFLCSFCDLIVMIFSLSCMTRNVVGLF